MCAYSLCAYQLLMNTQITKYPFPNVCKCFENVWMQRFSIDLHEKGFCYLGSIYDVFCVCQRDIVIGTNTSAVGVFVPRW